METTVLGIRTLRLFFTAAIVAMATLGCGGRLEPLPDVWPGYWPDGQRGSVRPDAGPGLTVDLLTFNIKFADPSDEDHPWTARRAIVADLVRDEHPDVVGLQEALRSQLDDLHTLSTYRQVGVGRDDGRSGGEHSAILYRSDRFTAQAEGTFWLSPTPDVPGSAGWGNGIPRVCTWVRLTEQATGHTFYVFNTHFDNRSQATRALGMELIAQRIAARSPPAPVVLMGDLNATEDNPAVQFVLGKIERASAGPAVAPPSPRLVDVFRSAHPNATGAGTYHRWVGNMSGRRIDYIFAPSAPTAEVLDAAILHARRGGRYPSDHFPVRARVWLAAR
jgi:endonuclease/exonuclease/phosphatase family metal-dependent hydrolase